MKKKLSLILIIGILVQALLSNTIFVQAADDPKKPIAYSMIGYALNSPEEVSPGKVSINALTAEGSISLTTKKLTQEEVDIIVNSSSSWAIKNGSFIEICYNKAGQVVTINKLYNLTAANCYFDTMKYGAEFSPTKDGNAGNLLAAGWVLDKTEGNIVIGDTNHFEEKYDLSDDVKVYEINTNTNTIDSRELAQLPVTQKTDGEYYKTANRQMAIIVFDSNYLNADSAKVSEIYYLTPQTMVEEKYLIEYDTMALYSCYPDTESGGVLEKPMSRPWLAYTEPFEIVPDKMYFVGDNDVAIYLFNTKDGLVLLDAGWPNCGYLYWSAIEELGFDPRDIKYILLTHGHADHYGTAYEFEKVLNNAGKDPVVYQTYEDTFGYDIYGYPEIGATLKDLPVRSMTDKYYTWEKWVNFGDVRLKPVFTGGHTPGTSSFIFEVTKNDGEVVSFGYMGGYGTVNAVKQGYLRLAFVHGLRYLQQNVEVDYSLPQHMAHFPMLEINKAAEKVGIPFLEALTPGNEEWVNFLERRMVMQTSEEYLQKWRENPYTADGRPIALSAIPVTNEAGGPWKRDEGVYNVTLVDSGKLMHGFNLLQNPNEAFDGVINMYGDNLGDGFQITRDGYMHDPDKWFLQLSLNVDDDYTGVVTGLETGNGPVEAIRDDWSEILRTVYFDSKEEAEAVLAMLEKGKTYEVTMDKNSQILVPEDYTQTFRLK